MLRPVIVLPLLLLAFFRPDPAAAQWPPERAKNVKVFPPDVRIDTLVAAMRGFTRALGVRCSTCHEGREEDPLEKYDFASDAKPMKLKAREMLRMVKAINEQHLAQLPARREPRITVTCTTCHRGAAEPRPLQQVLLTAYEVAGIDSALTAYNSLRSRYYGRAAYDFGEVPLADVATELRRRGDVVNALKLNLLNTEVLPSSGFAHRQAAAAHLAVGDTTAAIASLERALGINANDGQAKEVLGTLRR